MECQLIDTPPPPALINAKRKYHQDMFCEQTSNEKSEPICLLELLSRSSRLTYSMFEVKGLKMQRLVSLCYNLVGHAIPDLL